MKIVIRVTYIDEVVKAALEELMRLSPVGKAPEDKHPGLYRDSHMVFINGRNVQDMSGWKAGDTVHISNPVPYSRKIEAGFKAPFHVYEKASDVIANRFGNQASVKFVFMPITFGSTQAWAQTTRMTRTGRKMNAKSRGDWLVRQPAMLITAR